MDFAKKAADVGLGGVEHGKNLTGLNDKSSIVRTILEGDWAAQIG